MQIQTIAEEVFEVRLVTQIKPFSERGIVFSPTVAYAVAQSVADMQGGERLGGKIGFTNRSIWPIYDVNQLI